MADTAIDFMTAHERHEGSLEGFLYVRVRKTKRICAMETYGESVGYECLLSKIPVTVDVRFKA